jgi:hypothetical protein
MRLTIPLTTLACTLPLAACGSSSSSSNGAPTADAARYQQQVKFSQCMRTHGVSGFPDPSPSGNLTLRAGGAGGLQPNSPSFQSAQQACRSLLPNKGRPQPLSAAQQQQALRFSACMRQHGLSSFPDPQFGGGGVRMQLRPGQGLDPSSPAFKSAQKACGSLLPGKPQTQASTG